MRIRKLSISRLFAFIAITALLTGAAPAGAKLKETPPKNVALDGNWQIDAERSDDPVDVIENARDQARESAQSRGGGMHGMHGGGGGAASAEEWAATAVAAVKAMPPAAVTPLAPPRRQANGARRARSC